MLLSVVVNASGNKFDISTVDNFISARSGDDLTEVAKKLNMQPEDLNSYFSKNGLLYIAVSLDGKSRVKISSFTDNFSSEVGDIAYLNDAVMTEFINSISDSAEHPAQIIENNGRKFLCLKNTLKDSGGVYTVTQYVTIFDNKTYYFAGYNPGDKTSDEITTMFKNFNFKETAPAISNETNQGSNFNKQYLLINCGVVVFSAVAIISMIGIIKHYKRSKDNED